ncbi:MAG: type IV toxin-antitoxin system AbiEi family antitoxin domain-containing protein [Nitrospiria bacterium]
MKNPAFKTLLKKPSFTGRDAKACGIDPHRLPYYVKKGVLQRVARGIYRNPNVENSAPFEWQDLLETAQSIPGGTICLVSALSYYDLTQEIQRQFWIAVPHESKAPKRPKTKIVRMRNATLGRKPLVVGEYHTFIFDRERCIVDAFRYLSKETALRSLREYLKPKQQHKPDISKLARYAKALRVKIVPYIEALT